MDFVSFPAGAVVPAGSACAICLNDFPEGATTAVHCPMSELHILHQICADRAIATLVESITSVSSMGERALDVVRRPIGANGSGSYPCPSCRSPIAISFKDMLRWASPLQAAHLHVIEHTSPGGIIDSRARIDSIRIAAGEGRALATALAFPEEASIRWIEQALAYASANGHRDIVELFLERFTYPEGARENFSPLEKQISEAFQNALGKAIRGVRVEIVEQLQAHGVTANEQQMGETLIMAAHSGEVAVIQFFYRLYPAIPLVLFDVRRRLPDSPPQTILELAISAAALNGKFGAVEILLRLWPRADMSAHTIGDILKGFLLHPRLEGNPMQTIRAIHRLYGARLDGDAAEKIRRIVDNPDRRSLFYVEDLTRTALVRELWPALFPFPA